MKTNFERLHPILTPNYRLDWLTAFKVKLLLNFRKQQGLDADIAKTANWVNQIMSEIMNKETITWGISSQNKENFFGIVQLNNLKSQKINLRLISNDKNTNWDEILERVFSLVQQEFNLSIQSIVTNEHQSQLKKYLVKNYDVSIKAENNMLIYNLGNK